MITVPPGEQSTVNVSSNVLNSRVATAAALTADLLHQVASDSTCLESVRRLEVVVFGAGTLSPSCTYRITNNGGPVIQNFYGYMESWPSLRRPGLADGPQYISFHSYGGYEF